MKGMSILSEDISVALCTRNGARFIEAQLRSILNQTVPPVEIVLSDDTSSDDTVERATSILAPWVDAGGSLVLKLNVAPLGVTANFESAVRSCSKRLIALCDQDDLWHPNRVERAVREFEERQDLDLIFTDARIVGTNGESLDRSLFDNLEVSRKDRIDVHQGDAFSVFVRRNIATGATIMFRSRLLDVALPFPADWIHDEWLATVAATIGLVDLIDEALIDYRRHDSNVIGTKDPTLRRKVERVLQQRGNRNAKLANQFAELASRVSSLHPDNPLIASVLAKAAFESSRDSLPTGRLRRVNLILAADRRGEYARFASQGRLDIFRDLLQPHGE